MASSGVFSELLEAWRPEGVRVIVPDLRGAGDSEPARDGYHLERYAEDVVAVLDAEAVERAVLIGHSMGGQIAQLVAATRPARVAGLCAVLPVPADGLPLPADATAMFRSAGGNAAALGGILDMASPGMQGAIRERLLADALRITPRCVAETFDAWTAGGFADQLTAIRTRALVVASDDPFLPAPLLSERVVERIAGARLAKLDGAGHYAPNEQPRALAALLEAFLAGCPA
jgi:pimeloyl-ACP methyl ester carboxylesterase